MKIMGSHIPETGLCEVDLDLFDICKPETSSIISSTSLFPESLDCIKLL